MGHWMARVDSVLGHPGGEMESSGQWRVLGGGPGKIKRRRGAGNTVENTPGGVGLPMALGAVARVPGARVGARFREPVLGRLAPGRI
jgi:hypothetical protein